MRLTSRSLALQMCPWDIGLSMETKQPIQGVDFGVFLLPYSSM